MRKPSISPAEMAALFGDDRGQTIHFEEFTVTMDGVMMSPSATWAPQAELNGMTWFVTGEPGDPLDGREWIGPY